jgi:hypothetical protein
MVPSGAAAEPVIRQIRSRRRFGVDWIGPSISERTCNPMARQLFATNSARLIGGRWRCILFKSSLIDAEECE